MSIFDSYYDFKSFITQPLGPIIYLYKFLGT
jgi:hypothetical protein